MNRINLVILISVALIALLSCQKSKTEAPDKITDSEEMILVDNEVDPKPPFNEIQFIEDISIAKESWWPRYLLVNDREEIFVISEKERLLEKFSPPGDSTYIKEFPSGQAPGEFKGFDPHFSNDGRLFIMDWSQRRLTIFDTAFEIQDIFKLNLWGSTFRLDSLGNMYFLQILALPETTDRQKLVLTKCSPDGIPRHELNDYEWGQRRDSNGIYHSDAYRIQIKYKIHSNNNVYYARSDKYEINIVSSHGETIKRITKKGKSRKLTPAEIESFRPKKPNPRFVTDIPTNMPYIADLFLLEDDFLLVITFESTDEDRFLLGDVFDGEGIYRARVRIPKYVRWNFLLAPNKGNAIARNGSFYTIESDETEENFWVKRYKLIMNN